MVPEEILRQTRHLIQEHCGGDPDKWWYANRYVFARLMLDERKTKTSIKRDLLDAGEPCYSCGKPFETKRGVHLHRLDGSKGYRSNNCVLMHSDCHEQLHVAAQHEEEKPTAGGTRGRDVSATKWSKCYEGTPFLYWWDVSPALADSIDKFDSIEFGKKDTRERCSITVATLKQHLTPNRQTSRGDGNWGIKVQADRPDELALEPGSGQEDWIFLPVVWLNDQED